MNKSFMLKYQIKNCYKAFITYYAIYLACVVMVMLLFTIGVNDKEDIVGSGKIYGTELSTMIFMFVMSLCCFTDVFKFYKQVGFNRRDISKSFISSTLVISIAVVCVDKVVSLIINLITNLNDVIDDSTLYEVLFAKRIQEQSLVLSAIESILYSFLIFVVVTFVGRIIVNIFFRGNKQVRVLIAAGLPIFVFMLFPIIDNILFNNRIMSFIFDILPRVLGITSQNPYIGIATMSIAAIALGFISHILISRTQIKNR